MGTSDRAPPRMSDNMAQLPLSLCRAEIASGRARDRRREIHLPRLCNAYTSAAVAGRMSRLRKGQAWLLPTSSARSSNAAPYYGSDKSAKIFRSCFFASSSNRRIEGTAPLDTLSTRIIFRSLIFDSSSRHAIFNTPFAPSFRYEKGVPLVAVNCVLQLRHSNRARE